MHALLRPFPELVLAPNHTCLLLTPLLVNWLAEKLFALRKNPLLIFCCFSGFSSTCTYYITMNNSYLLQLFHALSYNLHFVHRNN